MEENIFNNIQTKIDLSNFGENAKKDKPEPTISLSETVKPEPKKAEIPKKQIKKKPVHKKPVPKPDTPVVEQTKDSEDYMYDSVNRYLEVSHDDSPEMNEKLDSLELKIKEQINKRLPVFPFAGSGGGVTSEEVRKIIAEELIGADVAGISMSVQYNENDAFAGDTEFLYNYNTNTLRVPTINASDIYIDSYAKVATHGLDNYDIYTLDDLPTPVSGVITLDSGVYRFRQSINLGTNKIELVENSKVVMYMDDQYNHSIVSELSNDTFITGLGNNVIRIVGWGGLTVVLNGDNVKFIDIPSGSFGIDFSNIIFNGQGGILGNVAGVYTGDASSGRWFSLRTVYINYTEGWSISDCDKIEYTKGVCVSTSGATGPLVRIFGDSRSMSFEGIDITINSTSASVFDIDPLINDTVYINQVYNKNLGDFFEQGSFGSITAFSDQGGGIVRVHTDTINDIDVGDSVDIQYTISYDGGYTVINPLSTTFDISATYAGTGTGRWSTGSLDEKNKYVNCDNNGSQPDSVKVVGAYVTNNANTTSVSAINTWYPVNVSPMIQSETTSQFTVINSTTGEIRYNGIRPFNGIATVSISAYKSGGANSYAFRLYKTVGDTPLDNISTSRELTTVVGNLGLVSPITLNPGDQFRLEVQGVLNNDIIIQNCVIVAK